MQAQLELLRKLQEFDLEIMSIREKSSRLRESLDDLQGVYDSLGASLETQKGQLEATRALMRDKERELDENKDRYEQSRGKLNAVANTRQYNALEKEMDTLKKMRAQLEEERDTLRENVESYEEDVSEKESKIADLMSQLEDERKAVEDEAADGEKKVKSFESERDRIKKDLPKPLVRRYDFILSRRASRAIVPAIKGVCTGCNMALPPQMFNELQMATRIIQCPSCQRILYYEEPGDEA